MNVIVDISVLRSLLNKVDIHTLCSYIVHEYECIGIHVQIMTKF